MITQHNENGSREWGLADAGGAADANAMVKEALVAYGVDVERVDEVLAQLGNVSAAVAAGAMAPAAVVRDAAMPAVAHSPNGNGSGGGVALSDNARVIVGKRYLMRDEAGEPVEDEEGLFRRVAGAVAKGSGRGARGLGAAVL